MDPTHPVISLNGSSKELRNAVSYTGISEDMVDGSEMNFWEFPVVDIHGNFCGSIPDYCVAEILKKLQANQILEADVPTAILEESMAYNHIVSPFTFAPQTSLEQVHSCFITLRLANAFVTKNGKVLGM
jgi:hypothetical protein